MKKDDNKVKSRGFSGIAIVSFFVAFILCFILISVSILNRANVERLNVEQLVLEKSLKINEIISKLYYETPAFFDDDSIMLRSSQILYAAELETINIQGFSYELFRIRQDTGEKEIIVSGIEHSQDNIRFVENHIQIHDIDWYLRVYPVPMWFSHPENLILIFTGLFLSCLIFIIVQNNIDLKKMRGVFETMANIDVLTGIFNRRYIEENIKRVINTVSRASGAISFLMIDVDYFKRYNDTYGHGKGDSCLKTIANALAQSLFREEDFVARYGGEEFVVVLPYCDERGAHKVAERMLQNIWNAAIPHEKNDVAGIVTVSIGVTTGNAEYTRSGTDYIKKADEALYMSKQSGRNKYTFISFP